MQRSIEHIARFMALAGGLVLLVLVGVVCVSVAGRSLNTLGHSEWLVALSEPFATWLIATGVGPVNGDFELVEAGIAFAIFAFLPICQLYSGHATVDVFTSFLPKPANRFLVSFWEIVLTAVILLITWRLFAGLQSKYGNGQTTFILQFPIWWAYAASFVGALVASVVAVYCALARLAENITGGRYMPRSGGAEH